MSVGFFNFISIHRELRVNTFYGREKELLIAFKNLLKNRKSYLGEVDGFLGFNLIRAKTSDDDTLYVSHSTCKSEDNFITWKKSYIFRKAHKGAGGNKQLYLGSPRFEGFNVVQ